MAKAKKAPLKKANKPQNRGLKIASILFVVLGALVALSMVVSSIFTLNPQPAPVATSVPPVISTVVSTRTP